MFLERIVKKERPCIHFWISIYFIYEFKIAIFSVELNRKWDWFRHILKSLLSNHWQLLKPFKYHSQTVCVIIKRVCQTETRSQTVFVQTACRWFPYSNHAFTCKTFTPFMSKERALRNLFSVLKPHRTSTHSECIYKSDPPNIIAGSF